MVTPITPPDGAQSADAANRPELPKRGIGGPPTCPDCGAISGGNATCSTCRSHWPGGDPVPSFEEQHEKNMHILALIRDDPGWALSRILRCEKLEEALITLRSPTQRQGIDQGRGVTAYIKEALKP